jgi:hypothetical protein
MDCVKILSKQQRDILNEKWARNKNKQVKEEYIEKEGMDR